MGNGKTGDAEGKTTFETLRTQFNSASRHFSTNEEMSRDASASVCRFECLGSELSLAQASKCPCLLNLCIADVTDQDSGSQCT